MATKQLPGSQSPDGSDYVCLTDGAGSIVQHTTFLRGASTQLAGGFAPDGSKYVTFTDGNGTLR